jgi:hypothetical protein
MAKKVSKEESINVAKTHYEELLLLVDKERAWIMKNLGELKNGNILPKQYRLREYLLWRTLYNLDEIEDRLRKVGGLGVGGLEPKHYPSFIQEAEIESEEHLLMNLQSQILKQYNQAMICYVDGNFLASSFLLVSLVEMVLIYEILRRKILSEKLLDVMKPSLGNLIEICKSFKIVNGEIYKILREINETRNSLIHAKFVKPHFNTKTFHEFKPYSKYKKAYVIYEFKKVDEDLKEKVDKLLEYFYSQV